MSPEDLAQITAIVAASEQRIIEAVDQRIAASEQRTIAAVDQRTTDRLDRAVEAFTANLSEVRHELVTRLETIERRTERTEINVNSILMQLAGISRSLTAGEQLDSQFAAAQGAQQRAFEQLVARVAKLERAIHPEQQ